MNEFLNSLRPYTKSIIAGVVAVLNLVMLFITLNADGKLSPEDMNALIGAVILAIGGTASIYQFPNKK